MADGIQAELAGAMLLGQKLEVNFSQYPTITPAPDAHGYSNSNLNRFNTNVAKNYCHCCAPTKMIHLSTLPQDITEDAILDHMGEHGTVAKSKLFEAGGKIINNQNCSGGKVIISLFTDVFLLLLTAEILLMPRRVTTT